MNVNFLQIHLGSPTLGDSVTNMTNELLNNGWTHTVTKDWTLLTDMTSRQTDTRALTFEDEDQRVNIVWIHGVFIQVSYEDVIGQQNTIFRATFHMTARQANNQISINNVVSPC